MKSCRYKLFVPGQHGDTVLSLTCAGEDLRYCTTTVEGRMAHVGCLAERGKSTLRCQRVSNMRANRAAPAPIELWQCPGSRAKLNKGEVEWRMPYPTVLRWLWFPPIVAPPGYYEMGILKDGRVVSRGGDGFEGFGRALASHPPAALRARRAEDLSQSALRDYYIAMTSAFVGLGAMGVAGAGLFMGEPWLLWPGLGGMVISIPFSMGFAASAGSSGSESMTEAMTAVDMYNDHLFP
jgi:hypothetical protein